MKFNFGEQVCLTEEGRYRFAKSCKSEDGQYRGCGGQIITPRDFEKIYLGEVGKIEDVGGSTGRVLVSWPSFPRGAWCDPDILTKAAPLFDQVATNQPKKNRDPLRRPFFNSKGA